MTAINVSLAFASIKKKVLLVGADLRNPKLHSYFGGKKDVKGLSTYLYDHSTQFDDCISKGFVENVYHEVCYSGPIPPNAPQLLSGERFEQFLETAREKYDYIVVDTAPTLLVTDTLLISQHADTTLYIVRADFTEKRLLEFSKELQKTNRLKNMVYVLNFVNMKTFKGYNYGYSYGYGIKPPDRGFSKYFRK